MLRPADWAFNHWPRRNMARDARPICRVSHRNSRPRRIGTGVGMDTSLATLAVRKPQAFERGLTQLHDTRVSSRRQFASLGRRRGANDVCLVPAIQMKGWLLPLSLGGAGLAAVCCMTHFLPWLFSLLGISGALGYVYRDDVLLPILAGFLILTGYALWQRRRAK